MPIPDLAPNLPEEKKRLVYRVYGGSYQPVWEARPERPPEHCGFSNEDLECLGCGKKIGCIERGHCYAMEGDAALKSYGTQK